MEGGVEKPLASARLVFKGNDFLQRLWSVGIDSPSSEWIVRKVEMMALDVVVEIERKEEL